MAQVLASPGQRAIDLVHLSRQTFGDQELEREILALFRDQCVRLLRVIFEADGPVPARNAAHTLKGAARGVGAFAVAEMAERIESGAGDVAAGLEALRSAVDDARVTIDRLLDTR